MEEQIPYAGGLNKDDDFLAAGEYTDANEIIIGTDIDFGEGGSVRGIKTMDSISSNEDIATLITASGDITYLDSATDNESEDIVYILCQHSTDVHILKYVISTDTATKVVSYTVTSPGAYMHFFRVLGEVLIWNYNDDFTVYSISKTASNISTSNDYELSLIGQSPTNSPEITITGTDFSLLFAERAWQFAHRFVYADGRISALSPISGMIGNQEADDDNITNISEVQVSITETWSTGVPPTKLEVYAREADIGTWRRAKTFDSITSGVANTFNWSGQRFETLPTDFSSSLFNFAPFYAKSAEVLDNRIFLGNGKFFDDDETGTLSIALSSGTGLEFSNQASGETVGYSRSYFTNLSPSGDWVDTLNGKPFANNSSYKIGVIAIDRNGRSRGVEDFITFNSGDFDYPIIPEVTVSASGTLPSWMYAYQIVISENITKDYFFEGVADAIYYLSEDDNGEYLTQTQDENAQGLVIDIKGMFEKGLTYTFQQGDRIRGRFGSATIQEADILSQRGSQVLVRIPSESAYQDNPVSNPISMWIEIYSPSQKDLSPFFGGRQTGLISALPATVNVEGDSFFPAYDLSVPTGGVLKEKKLTVTDAIEPSPGDGSADMAEFDTLSFNNESIRTFSESLDNGDNSGFLAQEGTYYGSATFTVDSESGAASVSIISRDPASTTAPAVTDGDGFPTLNLESGLVEQRNNPITDTGSIIGGLDTFRVRATKLTTSRYLSVRCYLQNNALRKVVARVHNVSGDVVTELDSAFEVFSEAFTSGKIKIDVIAISDTRAVVTYNKDGNTGLYARMLSIDGTTGAISFTGSEQTILAGVACQDVSLTLIDATNCLFAWQGFRQGAGTGNGISSRLYTLNTGTGAITANGTAYDITANIYVGTENSWVNSSLVNSTRAIVTWSDEASDGQVVMLTLDTGTPSLTATGSTLEFDTAKANPISSYVIDTSNILIGWEDNNTEYVAQLFTINTGSGLVAANGAKVTIDADGADTEPALGAIDSTHAYSISYIGGVLDARVLSFDTSAGTLEIDSRTEYESANAISGEAVLIDTDKIIFDYNDGTRSFSKAIDYVGTVTGEYTLTGRISIDTTQNIGLLFVGDIALSSISLTLIDADDILDNDTLALKYSKATDTVYENEMFTFRSVNASKRTTFWRKGLGKPYSELSGNVNEFLTNRVYYGQKYIKETNVNPFNYFYFDDAVQIPFEVGEINALVNTTTRSSSPGTLLVLCEEKPVSIYVGANLITNTDGSTSLIASDRVVNGTNVLSGNDGFQLADKNTIVSYDGQVFWRDAKSNGAICRYSREGVFKVSDLKMKSYFNSKKDLTASASYDPYYDMYLFTVDGTTIGFNGRWISFYSDRIFTGKASTIVGDQIYTFEDASGTLLAKTTLGSDQACDITLSKHSPRPIEPKYLGVVLSGMSVNAAQNVPSDTNFSVVVTNEKNQISTLTNYDFIVEDQDYLYADVMSNENSTGGKLSGEQLSGSKHAVKVNIPSGDRMRLIVMGWEPSLGHF